MSKQVQWYPTLFEALKSEGVHHLWPAFLTVRVGESAGAAEQGVFMVVERSEAGDYRMVQAKKVERRTH